MMHLDVTDGFDLTQAEGIINTNTLNNVQNLTFTWPNSLRARQIRWAVNSNVVPTLPTSNLGGSHLHLLDGGLSTTTGWTGVASSVDTSVVYVSDSAGSAGYDGYHPSFVSGTSGIGGLPFGPKKTISDGVALLRSGFPDWLLLKAGDVFTNQNFGTWTKTGRNNLERMTISRYGGGPSTPRPVIYCNQTNGFQAFAGTSVDNLNMISLVLSANATDNGGANLISNFGTFNNLLIEDCMFANGHTNIVINPGGNPAWARCSNIVIRRSQIIDSYTQSGDSQGTGIFSNSIDGFLVEECLFDQCGGTPQHPFIEGLPAHTVYNQCGNPQNNYTSTNVIFRGNVLARSGGLNMRSGGAFFNNLFLKNPFGLTTGTNHDNPGSNPNGVSFIARGNVFLDGWNFNDVSGQSFEDRGWAMTINNVSAGIIDWNIIANNNNGSNPVGIYFRTSDDTGNSRSTVGMSIGNNISYNWDKSNVAIPGLLFDPENSSSECNIVFHDNDIQSNFQSVSNGGLVRHNDNNGTNSSRSGLQSIRNRFWSINSSSTGWMYENGGESYTTWVNRTPSDIGSSAIKVTYPGYLGIVPSALNASSYFSSIGGSQGISFSAGTDGINAYLSALRAQFKLTWDFTIMPTYGGGELTGGNYAYGAGTVQDTLRFFRYGFGMSALELTVSSISPSSVAIGGGTVVTLSGSGFQANNGAYLNATSPLTVQFQTSSGTFQNGTVVIVSNTQATVTTPTNNAGLCGVKVDNGEGVVFKPNFVSYS